MVLRRSDEILPPLPNFAITPGHYLERYLVAYREVDLKGLDRLEPHSRIYADADDPARVRALLDGGLASLIIEHPDFYIESRDNVLLAFRPGHGLEPVEDIPRLLAFAVLLEGALLRRPETT